MLGVRSLAIVAAIVCAVLSEAPSHYVLDAKVEDGVRVSTVIGHAADSPSAAVQYILKNDKCVDAAVYASESDRFSPAFHDSNLLQAAVYLDRRIHRALHLGLGTGVVPTSFRAHGIPTDVVEASPAVVAMASKYFYFDDCRAGPCLLGQTSIVDSLAFVQGAPALASTYSVVLLHVPTDMRTLPLYTYGALSRLRSLWLAPDGVVVASVLGFTSGPYVRVTQAIDATFRAVFRHVRVFRDRQQTTVNGTVSLIYFASESLVSFDLPPRLEYRFAKAYYELQDWEIQPSQVMDALQSPMLTMATDFSSYEKEMLAMQALGTTWPRRSFPTNLWDELEALTPHVHARGADPSLPSEDPLIAAVDRAAREVPVRASGFGAWMSRVLEFLSGLLSPTETDLVQSDTNASALFEKLAVHPRLVQKEEILFGPRRVHSTSATFVAASESATTTVELPLARPEYPLMPLPTLEHLGATPIPITYVLALALFATVVVLLVSLGRWLWSLERVDLSVTPMRMAIERGHISEINAQLRVPSNTTLSSKPSSRLVKRINALLENGMTLLHMAVEANNVDVTTWLLTISSIDVNARDQNNDTPLMYAARVGSNPIVQLLMDAKAKTMLFDNDGKTAQDIARGHGHNDIAKLMTQTIPKVETSALKIEDELGNGGQGNVEKGKMGDTDVAIKTTSNKKHFEYEIAAFTRVTSRHIVGVLGHVPDEKKLILEYMDGSLDKLFKEDAEQWRARVVWIALHIAYGIQALHNLDMLHRDVKSLNVLVDAGVTKVQLADFGCAREASSERMTKNVGTDAWRAPEVRDRSTGQYGRPADIYSFGVVLIELYTWSVPVHNKGLKTNNRTALTGCDDQYKKLVEDCMAKEPAERPDIANVVKRLREMEDQTSAHPN